MNKAIECAIRLLTQREHGAEELLQKLCLKGFSTEDARFALSYCQTMSWQDETRYVESLCRTRIDQGYGPMRIRQELCAKKIEQTLVEEVLKSITIDWAQSARAVINKKFGTVRPLSRQDLEKQKRFLFYRGFPSSCIDAVLGRATAYTQNN